MYSARDLIKSAQVFRPEQTRLAEETERNPGPQNLQFTPTSTSAEGVVGQTSNGGLITVANTAQNFTPTTGKSYQLQKASGQVSLVANSRTQPSEVFQPKIAPIIATRAPRESDAGQDGQLWVNVSSVVSGTNIAQVWVYLSAVGGYVPQLSSASEANGYIEGPVQDTAYPLISSATFASKVASLSITVGDVTTTATTSGDTTATVGSTTVQLSVAIGSTVPVSGSLTLTPTATDGTAISFTVGYA